MAAASVLLLFSILLFLLPLSFSILLDQPATANLSTLWTLNSSLAQSVNYSDGSTVLPLLISTRSMLQPSFVFGFFCYAPCSTFLLSIYIVDTHFYDTDSPRVVWSANRDLPVHLNATLLFSSDGDLILRDSDGSFVWFANTSAGHDAETLNILDSGNLVVVDREGGQLWASFDHPTDSLLIGQSLRREQRLTANSSSTNATRAEQKIPFATGDAKKFDCKRWLKLAKSLHQL